MFIITQSLVDSNYFYSMFENRGSALCKYRNLPQQYQYSSRRSPLITTRGGYQDYEDYDEYDGYDRRHSRTKSPPTPRHRPSSKGNGRRRPPPSSSSSFDALQQAQELAKKTLSIASNTAIGTIKTSGKAAYYLTAPKFVSKPEIYGVWRLDQTIGTTPCAANIEFTPTEVITRYQGEEVVNGYLFQSRTWPRSCTIEFEAEAFQGPDDEKPVRFIYKGSFRRKLADKNVIKIVGKIYEIRKRFGKTICGEEVGSFVARRRMNKPPSLKRGSHEKPTKEDEENDDDVEYDDDYEYDEYHQYDEYDE